MRSWMSVRANSRIPLPHRGSMGVESVIVVVVYVRLDARTVAFLRKDIVLVGYGTCVFTSQRTSYNGQLLNKCTSGGQ